eukprot:gb/GEZN01027150.1/.p1 GENE.gb/GEZN01027150.1/~~gb/GEZN01027150.1/.p1  ORF type:complete len:154 (+),score=18.87 gb/GEZN01027150.1/:45-464(+)
MSLPEARYHKLLTLQYQDKLMKLKIRNNTSAEGIEECIRNRFGIPDDVEFVAVDFEGCDVVIDHTLTTGVYQVIIAQEAAKQAKQHTDDDAVPAGTPSDHNPNLTVSPASNRNKPSETVQPVTSPKTEVGPLDFDELFG